MENNPFREHENIEQKFINYLIEIGIPKRSIVSEWGGRDFTYDVVVLDDTLSIPIFIFEIKLNILSRSFDSAIRTLTRAGLQMNTRVRLGLVTSLDSGESFNIYDLTECIYSGKRINLNELDTRLVQLSKYDYQSWIKRTETNINIIKATDEQKNKAKLKVICWYFAPLLTLLLILLDRFCILILTTERLLVYGTCTLLALLPLISKLSIGALSFSLDKGKSDETTEKEDN